MTVLHIITDPSLLEGAQTMLDRLLRVCLDERIIIALLIDACKTCREAAANPGIAYAPQHARSMPALAVATTKLARLIRKEQPSIVLCPRNRRTGQNHRKLSVALRCGLVQ